MTSDSSSNDEPYIRYTREPPLQMLSGWFVKEGKKLKHGAARFLRLSSSTLSNHRNEHSAPTWSIELTGAHVLRGARRNELVLRASGRRLSLFAPTRDTARIWLFALRRAAVRDVRVDAFYALGGVIGDGANGDVLFGSDRVTGDPVAVKSLPHTGDCDDPENAVTEEEIRIARALNHPCLVRTFDVFRDVPAGQVHLVMEYVAGGELRARVDHPTGNLIKEHDAVRIARNLLSAVMYLHEQGIVHRDIKLENVLCVDEDESKPVRVKLADFGSSTTITSKRRQLNTAVGTGYYLAPEIIEEKEYGTAVDMWACGVLFYIMLSSQLPFLGSDPEEYLENVLAQDVTFAEEDWKGISKDAQEFIQRLMVREPEKRMTASEALNHRWVSDNRIESVRSLKDGDAEETEAHDGDGDEFEEEDGDELDGIVEGPRSMLFGKRRTAAEIVERKRERHRRQR